MASADMSVSPSPAPRSSGFSWPSTLASLPLDDPSYAVAPLPQTEELLGAVGFLSLGRRIALVSDDVRETRGSIPIHLPGRSRSGRGHTRAPSLVR